MSTQLEDNLNLILEEKTNKIIPENIKKDVQIFDVIGTLESLDTSDADATASDILNNKTAYVNGQKITGNITNNGTLNYTPTTQSQNIPAGYTSGGAISAVTSAIDNNIQAGNIKKDVSILRSYRYI